MRIFVEVAVWAGLAGMFLFLWSKTDWTIWKFAGYFVLFEVGAISGVFFGVFLWKFTGIS